MKVKVSKLSGAALDLAVSKASNPEGRDGWGWFELDLEGFLFDPLNECRYSPSTVWTQGGPIIEREHITFDYYHHIADSADQVHARLCRAKLKPDRTSSWYAAKRGPTILVSAMRCYVASKLGDEVDIPEELL